MSNTHCVLRTRLGNGKGTETVEVFKALWDFAGGVAGDLPLKAGQTVTLLRRIDNDWWEGESDGRAGVFPAKYVQALTEEERKQYEEEKRRKVPQTLTARKNLTFAQEAEVEKLRKVGQALKEKLDETAAQRMLDRQRKQQEDEAAEKAIELEELQEEALRKEQQEQLRKKQQAERIALRFSLWVKQLQGATEEELIKVIYIFRSSLFAYLR